VEEAIERSLVRRHHGVVAVGNPRGEIQAEHAADRVRVERHAVALRRRGQVVDHARVRGEAM
jgi:hypothetical protein